MWLAAMVLQSFFLEIAEPRPFINFWSTTCVIEISRLAHLICIHPVVWVKTPVWVFREDVETLGTWSCAT